MKKKIILLAFALMLFAGIVSASSINGDYKGNPIVKVTSNGKLLEVDEVPAQIYDGHTVVPISLLRQLGASVTWNQDSYTVDVKLSSPSSGQPSTKNNDIIQIAKDFRNKGYDFVQITTTGPDYIFINFSGNKKLSELLGDNDNLLSVLKRSTQTDAGFVGIKGSDGNDFSVSVVAVADYFSGKISEQQFKSSFQINGKPMSDLNNNQPNQQYQPQPENNNSNYTMNDALAELGITGNMIPTVDMKSLAIELMKVRQTKKQSDYSVRDALKELGIPQGATPTLATLKQAVELIKIK